MEAFLVKIKKLTFLKASTILATVILLAYASILPNQLFWDDYDSIVNNAYIKSWHYFPRYFSQNLTAGAGIRDNYWRPLLLLSFSLDYKLGKLHPWVYHLQNIGWHLVSTLLVFYLVCQLCDLSHKHENNFPTSKIAPGLYLIKRNWLAFFTALFFAIHPLQTEAVTYTAGRADPMHAAFLLLSLIYFLKTPFFIKNSISCQLSFSRAKAFYQNSALLYSLLFFGLALLTKERAIVLPGLISLILIFFIKERNWKNRFKKWSLALFPYVIVSTTYLSLRLTVLHFSNTFDWSTTPTLPLPNFLSKFLLLLKSLALYTGLIVWPNRLYMEKVITVPTSFEDVVVLVGLAIFSALIFLIFYFWKRISLVSLGIFWFFIALSPSLHVLPIQGLLYEHWLYFPLVGLWLAFFAILINKPFWSTEKSSFSSFSLRLFLTSLILILVVLAFCTRTIIKRRQTVKNVVRRSIKSPGIFSSSGA